MEEAKLGRLQGEEYLDLMLENGTINDIPDLVAVIRYQKQELEELRGLMRNKIQSGDSDTIFSALYMGAKKMRGYAKKVALIHNAYVVAEAIEQLPLPGHKETGGFGEH